MLASAEYNSVQQLTFSFPSGPDPAQQKAKVAELLKHNTERFQPRQLKPCDFSTYRGSGALAMQTPDLVLGHQSPKILSPLDGDIMQDLKPIFETDDGKTVHAVGVTNPRFRHFVKKVAGFPAYFGLVLFKRALDIRRARDSMYNSASGCFDSTVSTQPQQPPTDGCVAPSSFATPPSVTELHLASNRSVAASPGPEAPSAIPTECLNLGWYDRSDEAVTLTDLALIWRPTVRAASRTDKLLSLLGPLPTFQRLHDGNVGCFFDAMRRGYLSMRDMQPVVEALVDRHPMLAECGVRHSEPLRLAYLQFVLSSIFASLHGLGTGRITFNEVRDSNLIDALYMCAGVKMNGVVPFSPASFESTFTLWQSMEPDQDGLVNADQLANCRALSIPACLLDRFANGFAVPLQSRVAGCVTFQDFMWLYCAIQDQMMDSSVYFWIRCIDSDGDGRFGQADLAVMIHALREDESLTAMALPVEDEDERVCTSDSDSEAALPVHEVLRRQVFDIVGPERMREGGISALDIRRSNFGGVLFGVFMAAAAPTPN